MANKSKTYTCRQTITDDMWHQNADYIILCQCTPLFLCIFHNYIFHITHGGHARLVYCQQVNLRRSVSLLMVQLTCNTWGENACQGNASAEQHPPVSRSDVEITMIRNSNLPVRRSLHLSDHYIWQLRRDFKVLQPLMWPFQGFLRGGGFERPCGTLFWNIASESVSCTPCMWNRYSCVLTSCCIYFWMVCMFCCQVAWHVCVFSI